MRLSITTTILIIFIGGILVGAGWYAYKHFYGFGNGYVAAVMTTGDVYFGRVSSAGYEYVVLTNTYYPQTVSTADGGNEVRLVELGSELHRPESTIYLNRDHVTLLQKLQKESPIITTIKEYEGNRDR